MTDWVARLAGLDLGFWRIPDQVVRLAIVFLVLIAAMVASWWMFVPDSFGELGHYRMGAVTLAAAPGPKYAGWQACGECHEEVAEKKKTSFHRGLACETCHGPGQAHVAARMSGEEEPRDGRPHVPYKRSECLYCHRYLPSRPTGFPQVIEIMHSPAKPCKECHDPHDPTPPEAIGTCTGCHPQIAKTKAVSYHNVIECTTCHETPEEHKVAPRLHPSKKPTSRAFCGQCHVAGATPPAGFKLPKTIRRIEMETHGTGYPCWQCHYPHFPEGH